VKSFSTTLPRRVELRSRLKETEKKASSMIVLLAIEIPVTNHTKVANDIVKQIKNIYLNREYSVQMKSIKPNY
jgi:allophanate hydrolase subunit 1